MITSLPNKGYKWTDEQKLHASIAQKQRHKIYLNPYKDSNLPKEWCANISKGFKKYNKNHNVWNKGVSCPDEVKQHISEGRTSQPKRKSWTWSKESKRNRSIAVKAAWERKRKSAGGDPSS